MKRFVPFLISISVLIGGQDFSEYRSQYDRFEENDAHAFRFLQPYIALARSENNNRELFQAYKDAIYFTPHHKVAYADSAIASALRSKDSTLIATAYLTKGTVYYFTLLKYQPALGEYLKAYRYSKPSKDNYLHYKILYHIGVMKSYLGYHHEALALFQKCLDYFSTPQILPEPPNMHHNRQKGYLNALRQKAAIEVRQSPSEATAALIDQGLRESAVSPDFNDEHHCFYLLKGILAYHQNRPTDALSALAMARRGLLKKKDIANILLLYYYTGKTKELAGEPHQAILDFARVDSVFTRQHFILPEVRDSYDYLIGYYERQGDRKKQRVYTLQLLHAEKQLRTDFKHLAGTLFREYDSDTPTTLAEGRSDSGNGFSLFLWSIAIVMVLASLPIVLSSTGKKILDTAVRKCTGRNTIVKPPPSHSSVTISEEVAAAILKNLEILEQQHFYLQQGMSLRKLAPMLHTNSSYLSKIIKDHRNRSFTAYLKEMRILYATKMLKDNRKWRQYTLNGLAKSSGFSDRTNFSEAFHEYHHEKVQDFIRRLEG